MASARSLLVRRITRLRTELASDGITGIFGRGALGTLLVTGVGSLAGVGAQMVVARLVGTEQWGYYAVAWTLLNLLVLVGRIGIDTAEIRYVAAYRVGAEWGRLRGFLAWGNRTAAAVSLAVGGLTALVVLGLGRRLAPDLARTHLTMCLALPAFALLGLQSGALQGLRRVVLARIAEGLVRPLLGALLAAGLWWWRGSLDAPLAMLATAAAIGFCLALGWKLLRSSLPPEVALAAPVIERAAWLRTSVPLSLVSGMRLLLGQADILLVGALLGTTEAGIYAAASRLSHLITFGQNAANGIMAPLIAELHAQGEKEKLQEAVTLASAASTLFALAAAAALLFGGPFLLHLFGRDFVGSLPVLALLAAGQVVNASAGPVGYLLNMTGHQDANARILGWVVVANCLLAVPAILVWGAAGASVVTGAMIAVKNIWTWFEVKKHLGIRSSILPARRAG